MLRGLGRGRGWGTLRRSGATATGGTTDFASDFTAGATRLILLAVAEEVFEQLKHRAAIQLVALRLTGLFASRFASSNLLAGRFASSNRVAGAARLLAARLTALLRLAGLLASLFASRFASGDLLAGWLRGAALGSFASLRLAIGALGLAQILQAREQVADWSGAALLAFAAGTLATSLVASGIASGGLWASLDGFTGGDLGASAAATAILSPQVEFETEPLAAQGDAHKERSKNGFAFHRATTPLHGVLRQGRRANP